MSIPGFLEGKPFNALTLAIALVAIVVTAYFAQKTLRVNRRRLTVAALPPAPLLTSHSQGLANLQLTWNGTLLTDAHIVTFMLDNYGRAAIDSSSFDRGRPIRLNLSAPVVEVMSVSLRPKSASEFAHAWEENSVTIGPDVLKPLQRLTVQLLVAGEPDLNNSLEEYLTNTEVEYVRPGAKPRFRPRSRFEIFQWLLLGAIMVPLSATLVGVLALHVGPDAVLNFTPRSASAGQSIEVWGSEFRPNSKTRLSVRCDGSPSLLFDGGSEEIYPVAEPLTDSSGSFRIRVRIPEVANLEKCRLSAAQDAVNWDAGSIAERDFIGR
jgi:hypothetical protein